ncbi:MAG: phosphoribosylglycinamide formyltransferase [Lactobacillales bacterium]|nr:phosphoribosylglycinamide formyltransferase [Lactobacillales bacterium]
MMNIAIFASGNGRNFQVLAEKIQSGKINARLKFVFSDQRKAYVLKRAKKLNVLSFSFELKEFVNKEVYELKLKELLKQYKVDLIMLAGYMKIVGATLLKAYGGKIINIHPTFLPDFPGAQGIKDAWDAQIQESGVSVHYVNAGVDTGKIIQQVRIPRLINDTLASFAQRIHKAEYQLYPEVLEKLIKEGLKS